MRIVKLDGAACTKRHCAPYELVRAEFVAQKGKMEQILSGLEERILRTPESVGKWAKDPPGARNVHVAGHWVLWWRFHRATNEVEFLDIGHHDDFFRR
jgi:mRNA-degrading endonuclease YafQ of YafQ-DinJ toxin-antitoxin module